MRTIYRRPGYRSVHGETTKWVTEASDFKAYHPPNREMAWEDKRPETARLYAPRCWTRVTRPGRDQLFLARSLRRQGYSPPPNGTKVEDRNTGTRIVCPVLTGLSATTGDR